MASRDGPTRRLGYTPVRINNWLEYERAFGGFDALMPRFTVDDVVSAYLRTCNAARRSESTRPYGRINSSAYVTACVTVRGLDAVP